VLNQSIQDWGIRKTPSDKEDKIDAKLVGAYAAYARGLTPWYARGYVDMTMLMKGRYMAHGHDSKK